jgi:hypothetical protein
MATTTKLQQSRQSAEFQRIPVRVVLGLRIDAPGDIGCGVTLNPAKSVLL